MRLHLSVRAQLGCLALRLTIEEELTKTIRIWSCEAHRRVIRQSNPRSVPNDQSRNAQVLHIDESVVIAWINDSWCQSCLITCGDGESRLKEQNVAADVQEAEQRGHAHAR